jgi:phosphopentomutase
MRAFILVLDSFGIGGAPDAQAFGDAGANTLVHIAQACAAGEADSDAERQGVLALPNLGRLGLLEALLGASGQYPPGMQAVSDCTAAYGHACETSRGKDTPSGHWEIAGLPTEFDWGSFPQTTPCFPEAQIEELIHKGDLPGILGNCHASGTQIIEQLGEQHLASGKPICYTSTDSVFQIAAHEERFGLQRLYDLAHIAKSIFTPLNIARVIARPFVGDSAGNFTRTANRCDLTTPPHGDTLLDRVAAHGGQVVSIGKIADIFAGRGVTQRLKGAHNMALFDHLLEQADTAPEASLVFVNFVDFDMLYGHRRDIAGYATALEAFDERIPQFEAKMRRDDIALITADHGCDPTWPGHDHTREQVPALFFGPRVQSRNLGRCESFADMGQTLAAWLRLPALEAGCVLPVSDHLE